jgi:hypothetical protein
LCSSKVYRTITKHKYGKDKIIIYLKYYSTKMKIPIIYKDHIAINKATQYFYTEISLGNIH